MKLTKCFRFKNFVFSYAILPSLKLKAAMDLDGLAKPISPWHKHMSRLMMQGLVKQAAKKHAEDEWKTVPRYKRNDM